MQNPCMLLAVRVIMTGEVPSEAHVATHYHGLLAWVWEITVTCAVQCPLGNCPGLQGVQAASALKLACKGGKHMSGCSTMLTLTQSAYTSCKLSNLLSPRWPFP